MTDFGASRTPDLTRLHLALVGLVAATLAGCHKDMYDQPRYEPYSESSFFKDGTSFRPLVAGTIARGELRADRLLYYGKGPDGGDSTEFPFPITDAIMERGRQRFNIYCLPCHGALGDGQGMIVRRGMQAPPSFQIDRLKEAPVGHFFEVISNGYGAMYPYAYRIPTDDRWAIIAYVRALQFREGVQVNDLPDDLRNRLEAEQ